MPAWTTSPAVWPLSRTASTKNLASSPIVFGSRIASILRRRNSGSQTRHGLDVDASIDVPTFVDSLRLFRIGVSWGGHESLVVPALAALQQSPGANSFSRF